MEQAPQKGGRPPKYDRREVLNAILYVARTGCQWGLLPHDFPKWKTVYDYFVRWHDAGVFEAINARLRWNTRMAAGRNPELSAGIIDSQSAKIVANIGFSGFDGAKKVNGRKRHIVTDTLGLLLKVVVHEASPSARSDGSTFTGGLQRITNGIRNTAKHLFISPCQTSCRIGWQGVFEHALAYSRIKTFANF